MNKYAQSLRTYQNLQDRRTRIGTKIIDGTLVESDLIAYACALQAAWPHMYAVEQRVFCRQEMRLTLTRIDSERGNFGTSKTVKGRTAYLKNFITGEVEEPMRPLASLDDAVAPAEICNLTQLEERAREPER